MDGLQVIGLSYAAITRHIPLYTPPDPLYWLIVPLYTYSPVHQHSPHHIWSLGLELVVQIPGGCSNVLL